MSEETLDAIYRGEVKLLQPRDGYRFSLDPLWLAAFAGRCEGEGVDLGAGCGILTTLAALRGARRVVGVEVQPALARLAARNMELNGLTERAEIVESDWRELRGRMPGGAFDFVLSNPPYIPFDGGTVNPGGEKAVARHEVNGSLTDLARAAARLLKPQGRLLMVMPAARLEATFQAVAAAELAMTRIKCVHSFPGEPAKLALVEARKGGRRPLEVSTPLVVHGLDGAFSPEASVVLEEPSASL